VAFAKLKEALTEAPILHPPIWGEFFKLICDASSSRVVLGQRIDKKHHVTYYASHTLNKVQVNYTMSEKEFLVVVLDSKSLDLTS